MSPEAKVRFLGEEEHERWARFVASSSAGSLYAIPEYLAALCEATGGSFRVLAAEKGNDLLGGVALYEERSRFGAFVSDRRLLYYNGLVLRDYDTKYPSVRTARQLDTMGLLEAAIRPLPLASVRLKSRSPLADARLFVERGWRAFPSYSYVVPIGRPKEQWERVEQNLRRLVDRCAEAGVTFSEEGDFGAFFRLHAATGERKGAPVYLPEAGFRRYFERLHAKDLARIFEARLPGGSVIASQLVLLGPHKVCHTVAAGADAAHQKLGANAFLRWRAFEALGARGYEANDLTDASLNPVTHFKSQLGGNLELGWVFQSPETRAFRFGRWLQRAASRR